ncbi:MAG: DUF302 domain-containing protein [Nitrospinota bacterium]|nr:DUF302 domain-containing protein [Nitrospinota bacterium]
MMQTKYGFGKEVDGGFDETVAKVKSELATVGFGVLTEIDVKATLKKKLDKDVAPYVILGACNPPFAARALEAEPSIGLLLPCNVVVRQVAEGKMSVEFMDPNAVLSMVDREDVHTLAGEVRPLLEKVMAAI